MDNILDGGDDDVFSEFVGQINSGCHSADAKESRVALLRLGSVGGRPCCMLWMSPWKNYVRSVWGDGKPSNYFCSQSQELSDYQNSEH